jgi:large subunit ribosomal protein L4|tara:strand:+ start:4534 stop:5157 length:624 start_codon:yes stop_codon:yes gene_type:complete
MKLEKLSIDGNKNSIEVTDKIFTTKVNKKLISEILYKNIANFKGRKAKTKQKNEIIGSTSKIYAQKGTGNARHASRKAPIFVGGGVAHGPKGEDAYKFRKLNKKEKRIGLASIITEKNNFKDLIVFNDFDKTISKTKEMFLLLKKFEATNSIILLDKASKDKIGRSLKNIPNVKVSDIGSLALYDLVKYKKVIFTESSMKELEKRYS